MNLPTEDLRPTDVAATDVNGGNDRARAQGIPFSSY